MKRLTLFLFFSLRISVFIATAEAAPNQDDFVIDSSKPYVYLKFDHVGSRVGLPGEEPGEGVWLRLVNNCRVPIQVATFSYGAEGSEVGVFHDVVRVSPEGAHLPSSIPEKTPSLPDAEMPKGYYRFEESSTTTVTPGSSLLFSVPFHHIQPFWYLQMRFYFELPHGRYGLGPYSVVSFVWQDIPKQLQRVAGGSLDRNRQKRNE